MRNSKPVTVNFEVRGLAVNIPTRLDVVGGCLWAYATHYAGKSSNLKAAATMAHCANEG